MKLPLDITELGEVFKKRFGDSPVNFIRLSQSGSDRRYYRLYDSKGDSAIATSGLNHKENKTFISLASLFREEGINVPEIYGFDRSVSCYLQEDLGDISLYNLINKEDIIDSLIKSIIDSLVAVQIVDRDKWKNLIFSNDFSERMILWDLNYFKYCFMLPSLSLYDEDALENDFKSLSDRILSYPTSTWGFMYRDFQSRNIMIKNGLPFFIDFQGGRFGPGVYDLVSFLYQAKAGFSDEFKKKWIDYYITKFAEKRGIEKDILKKQIQDIILFRTLQVLGAYGFRGLIQNKSHFLESIPPALKNLQNLIDYGVLNPYPELKNISEKLITGFLSDCCPNKEKLTVEIFSFSYKNGYPKDFSGNGGGFMFDCRFMTNPGRYDQYKPLTGRDTEVIEFLEERGEVQVFLKDVWEILLKAIEKYIKRDFTNLQIGFGCTGGRHRSVYCAEATARHFHQLFPQVNIKVCHREQNINYNL